MHLSSRFKSLPNDKRINLAQDSTQSQETSVTPILCTVERSRKEKRSKCLQGSLSTPGASCCWRGARGSRLGPRGWVKLACRMTECLMMLESRKDTAWQAGQARPDPGRAQEWASYSLGTLTKLPKDSLQKGRAVPVVLGKPWTRDQNFIPLALQKTNSECIQCLSVNHRTTEPQGTLSDIDRGDEMFNMSPGSRETKGEVDERDYSQLKPSAQQKKPSTEWKSRESGKTFANCSSDAELISRLGKEFRNLMKIFQQT